MNPASSAKKSLATIVLGFEIVVVFLAGLTIFGLRLTTPPELAIYAGVGLIVLIVVAMAVMRRGNSGIALGWVIHALYFTAAFVLIPTLFLALTFGGLWVFAMYKGNQVDALKGSPNAGE